VEWLAGWYRDEKVDVQSLGMMKAMRVMSPRMLSMADAYKEFA
jgi:hypothetical protein